MNTPTEMQYLHIPRDIPQATQEEVIPRIFIWQSDEFAWGHRNKDLICTAISEDGVHLASHLSSTVDFARLDMGIGHSRQKHDSYKHHYPQGYILVDLIGHSYADLGKNTQFQDALRANARRYPRNTEHGGGSNDGPATGPNSLPAGESGPVT